jgi:enamine deaminase RidA (YjgF/YER057c/UK114 family)
MSIATTELPPLRLTFGGKGGLDPGVRVLGGESAEDLFGDARPAGRSGDLALFRAGDWLLGAATVPVSAGLEETARRLYADIFPAVAGQHLARIWNYVPGINATGPGGLENYRAFCAGRSLAFEAHFGREFNARLPSASAVGCEPGALTVVFAASSTRPRHVENPLQVAAYDYPGAYGPRAPSFARATVVPGPEHSTVFISGTAAIRGHASVAPDNPREQLACTLENLRGISLACGLGPDLARDRAAVRHFKVYVRHAADQPMVAGCLREEFLSETDLVSYLHADICRAPLLVEIEASLFGVPQL